MAVLQTRADWQPDLTALTRRNTMLIDSKPLRLLALLIVLGAIPALAQFEVSPDHFDSPDLKTTKQNKPSNRTVHKPTGTHAASKTATRQETIAKSKKLKSGSASAKSKTSIP
jgi:hypothetical protein